MPGRLLVVATPIGNLGDLSPRAGEVLAAADIVACEDTRRSRKLLSHLGIARPLVSLHEHNERRRLPRLLAELEAGRTIALVSDAGTPLISDPGYLLVREAITAGYSVESVPGPSAALAALTVSGLPPYPHLFLGFPPPKRGRRRSFYERAAELPWTLVLFESPHRLQSSLEDLLEVLGDRPAALARELTKVHEEVVRGSLAELLSEVGSRDAVRGEIVLVVSGAAS